MSDQQVKPSFDLSTILPTSSTTGPVCTTDTENIRQFLDLLFPLPPGESVLPYHYGIRTGYYKQTKGGRRKIVFEELFNHHDPAVEFACNRSEKEETFAVWVTINSVDRKSMTEGQKATGMDNIVHRNAFFIDFDNQRPKDTNATEAERKRSEEVAHACREWLAEQGFPEPALCDSGNGHHLLYRTDLPVDDRGLIESFLQAVSGRFTEEAVNVDTVVHDPARVCKLPGTITRKGDHTQERPQRMAKLLDHPRQLALVSQELLRKVAGESYRPKPAAVSRKPGPRPTAPSERKLKSRGVDIRQLRVKSVLTYLAAVGIETTEIQQKEKEKFTVVTVPYCPFKNEEHTDGNTGILVYDSGKISVKCYHRKCKGGSWAKLQEAYGLKYSDVVDETATEAIMGTTDRKLDDPLMLAQMHNRKWFTEDGTPTLVCFGDETNRYHDEEAWVPTSREDLFPWVRATVQEVFDEHARIVSEIKGKRIKPRPVTGGMVNESIRAMQSLCRRAILTTAQPPFWLEPVVGWDADDLLILKDHVVNVRRYADGEEDYWIPRTPKLFYRGQSRFDFDPDCPEPTEWLKFLTSLEQSDDWYELLQQIMGYCLLPSYDLQKYFMLVGPKRSGKGTITRVLEDLLGGSSVACSLNLKNFASEFGLEKAVGKRLAIVPEIGMPKANREEIVNNLKAITGGDLVAVNRKNKPELSMRLQMRIIMITNNFVALPDNSGALHARVVPIKLTKSFWGKEDEELADKLKPEYPGILIWALEGLRKLRKAGGKFTLPQSTQDELDQLAAASAPLQAFVEECCQVDLTQAVRSTALYEVYKAWNLIANPGTEHLSEQEVADGLKSTVSTIRKERATKSNVKKHKDFQVVQTDFDGDRAIRSNLWLGICPKPECRTESESEM